MSVDIRIFLQCMATDSERVDNIGGPISSQFWASCYFGLLVWSVDSSEPRGGSTGKSRGPLPRPQSGVCSHAPQMKFLLSVTGHQGWKCSDMCWFYNKSCIFVHIWPTKVSQWPAPFGDLYPTASLIGGARTAPVWAWKNVVLVGVHIVHGIAIFFWGGGHELGARWTTYS